jgi:hypothetical protein
MKIAYISGPISGMSARVAGEWFKFGEAAARWDGFSRDEIIVPSEVQVQGWGWERYMVHWLEEIISLRPRMYMLPNWKDSKGAREEHSLALDLGLEVIYL